MSSTECDECKEKDDRNREMLKQNKILATKVLKLSDTLKECQKKLSDTKRAKNILDALWTKDDIQWRLKYGRMKELNEELNNAISSMSSNTALKKIINIHNHFILNTDKLIVDLVAATELNTAKKEYDGFLRYVTVFISIYTFHKIYALYRGAATGINCIQNVPDDLKLIYQLLCHSNAQKPSLFDDNAPSDDDLGQYDSPYYDQSHNHNHNDVKSDLAENNNDNQNLREIASTRDDLLNCDAIKVIKPY